MAARSCIIILLTLFIPQISYSSTPWLPENGEHFISLDYRAITGFSAHGKEIAYKYYNLQSKINYFSYLKSQTESDESLSADIRKKRSEIYQDEIKTLKGEQRRYKKSFLSSGAYASIEKGYGEKYSLGFFGKGGKTSGFANGDSSYQSGGFFMKRKFIQNKYTMFSGELGAEFDDFRSGYLSPYIGLNVAKIQYLKSGRKVITEYILKNNIDKNLNLSFEYRKAIEFKSGLIIQTSSYNSYNSNLYYSDKYYYKDQLKVAIKSSTDILFFPENTIFSLGIYFDYFGVDRRPSGKGIMSGIWINI
jgi:hypothetical protein